MPLRRPSRRSRAAAARRVPQMAVLACFVADRRSIPVVTSDEYLLRVRPTRCSTSCWPMGLNVAVGWAGLLDLGYIAFYGFAAYLFAAALVAALRAPLAARGPRFPSSIVATIILGFLLALPSRRLSGDYLAIVTLFFGQIFVTFVTQG